MHKSCKFFNIHWIEIYYLPTFRKSMAGLFPVLRCAPGGIVLQSIEQPIRN